MATTPTVAAVFVDSETGVELTVTAGEAGTASVQRSVDGGSWTAVYGLDGAALVLGANTLTDHWIPSAAVVEYRVANTDAGGTSAWSTVAVVSVPAVGYWLRHATLPAASMELFVVGGDVLFKWGQPGSAKYPLGAVVPNVVQGVRRLEGITLPEVLTGTLADRDALLNLLGGGRPMWFATDDGEGLWVRCLGGFTVSQPDQSNREHRRWTFDLTPVAAP